MKAVILAAGGGERLRPLTDTQPTCMLKVGQRSLLGRTVDTLISIGVEEIVVATGRHDEMIRSFLRSNYPGQNIQFEHNKESDTTGSAQSLWLTRRHTAGQDLILVDGDVVFDQAILRRLMEEEGTVLAISTRQRDEEKARVVTASDGTVVEVSKSCDMTEAAGEMVGVTKMTAEYSRALFKELEQMVRKESLEATSYQLAMERMTHSGHPIHAVDTTEHFSARINTREDLRQANASLPEEIS